MCRLLGASALPLVLPWLSLRVAASPPGPSLAPRWHCPGQQHSDTVSLLQTGTGALTASNSSDRRLRARSNRTGPGAARLAKERAAAAARRRSPVVEAKKAPAEPQRRDAAWSTQFAWLFQGCGHVESCMTESAHALMLFIGLSATVCLMICAFAFFREDKEEQLTPLCPQLFVQTKELSFTLPLGGRLDGGGASGAGTDGSDSMAVTEVDTGKLLCKVAMDWPDTCGPGQVAATVRLSNRTDQTLATVIGKRPDATQRELTLCREGCEIFGFVMPDGRNRYHVKHRTGVHLLTLVGDFQSFDVEGFNPVGYRVFRFGRSLDEWAGRVVQNVDAGLMICSLLAAHVHRRLQSAPQRPTLLEAPSRPLPSEPCISSGFSPSARHKEQDPESTKAAKSSLENGQNRPRTANRQREVLMPPKA